MLTKISKVLSVIVGLTVINVWLFRSGKSTSYRGGDASNLMEEFEVYGLGDYFMTIGIIKVSLAVLLLLSIYFNKLKLISSLGIAIGYADLVHGFGGISLNQTGRAIEIMLMVMLTYLTISLTISFFMNLYNKSVQFKGNA